jgi:hypothetical protein
MRHVVDTPLTGLIGPWLILLQPESLGEGSNKLLIAVIPSQMFVMFVFQVAKP